MYKLFGKVKLKDTYLHFKFVIISIFVNVKGRTQTHDKYLNQTYYF